MQSSSSPGMWGRYVLFIVLSFGILLLNVYLMSVLRPPPKEPPPGVARGPGPEEPAAGQPGPQDRGPGPQDEGPGRQREGVAEEREGPAEPAEGARPAEAPPEPPEGGPDRAAEGPPAEVAPPPAFPRRYVSLGSVDPKSPYRMLVTLTSEGAAVVRTELASPRYRDLEDRSGYPGHLVVDRSVRGPGCPVQVVGAGTPAARAGLEAGDTILKLGGQPLDGPQSLAQALAKTKPGQTISLTVRRGGKTVPLRATLGRRPLEVTRPERHRLAPIQPASEDPLSLLLTLRQIDDQRLKLPGPDEAGEKSAKGEHRPRPGHLDRELAGVPLRHADWQLVRSTPSEAVFSLPLPAWNLEVTKAYRLERVPQQSMGDARYPAYHLTMTVQIRNRGDRTRKVAYQLDGPTGLPTEGYWYASKVGRGWGGVGIRDVVVSFDHDLPRMVGASKIAEGETAIWKPVLDNPEAPRSLLTFIGVDAQYFSVVLIPQRGNDREVWFAESQPIRVGPVHSRWPQLTNTSCRLVSRLQELKPGQSFSHTYRVFAGPKQPALLAQYGLKEVVYYGWYSWVAVPMLAILHFFHDYVVFNYGLAIILLTVVVRLCMFPLSKKQAINAQKMQELQPEIKRIAEQYKNNLEARTKAQKELFKKHNFNPMGGCLPLLIQLPIFIGLYRSLMVDVELRQAPLIPGMRWCSNLAAPDMLYDWSWFMPAFVNNAQGFFGLGPYFNLLPLLTVILFLVQQKMFMPPPADEQAALQQNIMKFMMLFIGLLFFKVASGLCLYFIASSLWGVAERKYLPKRAAAAGERGGTGPPGDGRPKRPPPQPRRAATGRGRPSGDGATTRKKKKKSRGRR